LTFFLTLIHNQMESEGEKEIKTTKAKRGRVMTPEMLQKLALARVKALAAKKAIREKGKEGEIEALQKKMDKLKMKSEPQVKQELGIEIAPPDPPDKPPKKPKSILKKENVRLEVKEDAPVRTNPKKAIPRTKKIVEPVEDLEDSEEEEIVPPAPDIFVPGHLKKLEKQKKKKKKIIVEESSSDEEVVYVKKKRTTQPPPQVYNQPPQVLPPVPNRIQYNPFRNSSGFFGME
jgi:hypothetical protein